MSTTSHRGLAAALLFLIGCSPSFSDYAELEAAESAVLIDINCDTDSCAGDAVSFTLSVEEHLAWPADGEALLVQYRVDYDIDSIDEEIPWFSDSTSVSAAPGKSTGFEVALVGRDQRSAVGLLTDGLVAGEAILTLEGFAPDNTVVQIDTTIAVTFKDVIGDSDTSTDTGLGSF